MATKSSKSLWTSPMATTDSGAFTGAVAGPAHAGTAQTRTSSREMWALWVETHTGRRSTFLTPKSHLDNPQIFIESIAFTEVVLYCGHLRLRPLHKSTKRDTASRPTRNAKDKNRGAFMGRPRDL